MGTNTETEERTTTRVIFTTRLPVGLVDRLDAYAKRVGVSRQSVMSVLLTSALDKVEQPPA